MAITSKKLLTTLAAVAGMTLTASSVVACGFSLQKIINREKSSDELIKTFGGTITSWNTAQTYMSNDHKVLANTNASLLGVDEYGRVYGDIFESNSDTNNPSKYVGKPNKEFTEWTYKIRDNINWYKWDGSEEAKITTDDFITAVDYIMRSSTNTSQVTGFWNSFIRGAKELNLYLTKNPKKTIKEAFAAIENDWDYPGTDGKPITVQGVKDGFGMTVDKDTRTVKYSLIKSAEYFETLLCHLSYAPIHLDNGKKAKDISADISYKDVYYSGAYLPKSFDSTEIDLVKNENYWFKDMVTIKSIKYLQANGATKARELFEAGDSSGFQINSADNFGWERYIGDDVYNPTFDHLYDTPVRNSLASSFFFFNPYNGNIDPDNPMGTEKSRRSVKASKLLQNKLVKGFIATSIQRSALVKYYSEKFDGDSNVSKMLRNIYTPANFAYDENNKDYIDYIKEAFVNVNPDKKEELSKIDLSDGVDVLGNNSELFFNKTTEQIIKEITDFMLDEGIISSRDEKFEIDTIQSPSNDAALNAARNNMFERFNEIPGNPIKLGAEKVNSGTEAYAKSWKGDIDFGWTDWTPDYQDPGCYLYSLTVDGDMKTITGTSRAFDEKVNDDGTKTYSIKNAAKTKSSVSEDFADAYTTFNNEIIKADVAKLPNSQRFKEFAKQEVDYMYKNFIIFPFFIDSSPVNYSVSQEIPYTNNYAFAYGTASYKDFTKMLKNKIVSRDEANAQKQRVQDYANSLTFENNYKKDDQNDRNYILYKK
ncbi:oligopeptide ABC transporter substrate-binding protein [Spiroplasma helicoides]|uniref:Oligopeptide ABC transporter substrate-binding protein n=1 Tax=Spiroplasma helicoides TaxID=216938 RepID=A0A1B3SKL4_9MOLU|nr:ABC transporter substrate-binding protein [Spiroplasma helicoides]AOG60457.1 oligopeptide ABC transporter substrate-binding protein [Spiroplasma helicoides]